MKWLISLFLIVSFSFAIDSNFELENTNIISKNSTENISDYNRLRLYGLLFDDKYENYLGKFIIDNYNNYNGEDKDNKNNTKIYRAYLKYSDENQIITLGRQRIPFGVGRIWNPIDIYNPINATAIETSERRGTDSLRYEYALNELSSFDMTLSEYKYALRVKGNVDSTDLAFVTLKDRDKNQTILGYEASGEFLDTGIELRSEGGYFDNENSKNYKEFILGGEYGFENSLTLLGEYKYNSLNSQDYLALNLSYTLSTLWRCSYLGIKNLDDKSTINIAKFDYSLSDESEINFGTYVYTGSQNSEYGALDNSIFIRYFIYF